MKTYDSIRFYFRELPVKIEKVPYESQVLVVRLTGEFDSIAVPTFNGNLPSDLSTAAWKVILNMRYVSFLSSSSLLAITTAARTANSGGGELVIAQPSMLTTDLFEKLGLSKLLQIFPLEQDALDWAQDFEQTSQP